jgi:hypothetical protein
MSQLDLFSGLEKRDQGVGLASAAQDRDESDWSVRALEALIGLARLHVEIHTDDLTAVVPAPAHFNAWGAVWLAAIRSGVIERTGRYRKSADPKKHAHVYPIYRSRLVGPQP